MSLLNKMLADLETRGVTPGPSLATAGLQATHAQARVPVWRYLLALLVLAAGAGAWWHHRAHTLAAASRSSATVAVPTVAAPAVMPPPTRAAQVLARPIPHKPPLSARVRRVLPMVPVARPVSGPVSVRGTRKPSTKHPSIESPGPVDVRKVVLPPSPAEQAQALYRQAVGSLRDGRPGLTMRLLRQALVADPSQAAPRLLLATLELQAGQTAPAQVDLLEGIRRQPHSAALLEMLAHLRLQTRGPAAALAVLQPHTKAAAGHPTYLAMQAALEEQLGFTQAAVHDYRLALGLAPTRGSYWAGLAIALQGSAPAAAHQAFEKALLDPHLAPALRSYCQGRVAAN